MSTTLVIMAAGLGSRYGGNKQTEGIGPNHEMLMEYSLFDAVRAGFDKAVFIIKPEMEPLNRFFSYWKEQKPLLDALDRSQCNALLMDRVVRFVLTYNPSSLTDVYPELLEWDRDTQIFFISGLFGMMLDWHVRGFDSSVEEISQSLM